MAFEVVGSKMILHFSAMSRDRMLSGNKYIYYLSLFCSYFIITELNEYFIDDTVQKRWLVRTEATQ